MHITINIPDNLPPAIVQQYLAEFEEKLTHLLPENHKTRDIQAIRNIIQQSANLPTIDLRTANEILGYDNSAMGLWGDE